MAVLRTKTYFLEEDRITGVGSISFIDKTYPGLERKSVVRVEVLFNRDRNILRIFMDYFYFNEDGRVNFKPQDLRTAGMFEEWAGGKGMGEERKNNTAFFRYRPKRVRLSDLQKKLLQEQIDRDFGAGTWDSIPGPTRWKLWAKNCVIV